MEQQSFFDRNLFEGFQMYNLPNAPHGEANHDILDKAKATPAIVQYMPGPLRVYEEAVRGETEATFKDLTESITKEINEVLVPKRNSVETGLKALFRAQEESDDAQVAADARTLTELAHLHRVHTDMKLDAQTDHIRDFCVDVETNHAAALQSVGGETLFAKLKAANDAVCNAMMRRFEIESERAKGVMERARRQTDNAYRGLAHCVEAFVYMQGIEPYESFIAFVNQLFKYYKRIYPSTATSGGEENSEGTGGPVDSEGSDDSENTENSEGSENTELDPAENISIVFRSTDNKILHEMVVPVDYQIPESEFPAPPEGTHWNFTLADLNLAIGMKNPGDTITVRAQA